MRSAIRRRVAVPAAITSGLLLSGLLVWHTSYAAFTASTDNPGNSFTAGRVTLTDNKTGTAMFTANALKPTSKLASCIAVTYGGNIASTVTLAANHTTTPDPTTDLSPYLTFKIEEVPSAPTDPVACAALTPTTEFAAASTKLSTKVTALTAPGISLGWTPSAAATKYYRFSYELDDNNAAQNKSANVAFTWTATNT